MDLQELIKKCDVQKLSNKALLAKITKFKNKIKKEFLWQGIK